MWVAAGCVVGDGVLGQWIDGLMKAIDEKQPDVHDIARIVAALDPETIYLYGLHAYGQPHQDSDVDLLVVVRESALPSHLRAIAAYRALRDLFMPAEIKVTTRAVFQRLVQWSISLERMALEKGRRLGVRA